VLATLKSGKDRFDMPAPAQLVLNQDEFDSLSDEKIILKLLFQITVTMDPTLKLFFDAARMLVKKGKVKPMGVNRHLKNHMEEEFNGISFYRTYFVEMNELGRGSFGKVFLVQHKLDERFYAIKQIEFGSRCHDDYKHSQVFREVKALSQIDSKNVVRYYGAWVENKGMKTSSSKHSLLDEVQIVDEMNDYLDIPQCTSLNEDSWGGTSQGFVVNDRYLYDGYREITPESCISDFVDITTMTKSNSLPNFLETAQSLWVTINLYLQMEYAGPWTLKDFIRNTTRVPKKQDIYVILSQMLKGLIEIHKYDVIHRDLKPANVFIDRKENPYSVSTEKISDSKEVALYYKQSRQKPTSYTEPLDMDVNNWQLKIGDFGLSRSLGVSPNPSPNSKVSHSRSPSIDEPAKFRFIDPDNENADGFQQTRGLGTWPYTSPEQLGESDKMYGGSADMFSLGIIMYELMVPTYTTEHERAEVLNDLRHGVIPSEARTEFPELCELLALLISHNPEDRPTAEEALEKLQNCASLDVSRLSRLDKQSLIQEVIRLSKRVKHLELDLKAKKDLESCV